MAGIEGAIKALDERAAQAVRSLRAQATALNLLATEIETTPATSERLEKWAAVTCAHADQVDHVAERLRGAQP